MKEGRKETFYLTTHSTGPNEFIWPQATPFDLHCIKVAVTDSKVHYFLLFVFTCNK